MGLRFFDCRWSCVDKRGTSAIRRGRTDYSWRSILTVLLLLFVSVQPTSGEEHADSSLVIFAQKTLAVIDALLEERSAGVLFTVHKDEDHSRRFQEQAAVTDTKMRELVASSGGLGLEHPAVLAAHGPGGEMILDGASDTRGLLMVGAFHLEQLMRSYGVLLEPLWAAVVKATESIQSAQVAASLAAQARVLAIKESFATTRDLVEAARVQGRLHPVLQLRLTSFDSTVAQLTSEFTAVATQPEVTLYESLQAQDEAAKMSEMDRQAIAAIAAGNFQSLPPDWLEVQAKGINLFAEMDEALSLSVQRALEGPGQQEEPKKPISMPLLAALWLGLMLMSTLLLVGRPRSKRNRATTQG